MITKLKILLLIAVAAGLTGCGILKEPKLGEGGNLTPEQEQKLAEAIQKALIEAGLLPEIPDPEPDPDPDPEVGDPIYPSPNPATGMSQVPPAGAVRSESGLAKESVNDDGSLRGIAVLLPSSWHGYVTEVKFGSKNMGYAPWSKPEHTNAWRPTYRINGARMSGYVGQRITVTKRDGSVYISQVITNGTRVDPLNWTKVN
jgi:hypothetical protein